MVLKHLAKHNHSASQHCPTSNMNDFLMAHHGFYSIFLDMISASKY